MTRDPAPPPPTEPTPASPAAADPAPAASAEPPPRGAAPLSAEQKRRLVGARLAALRGPAAGSGPVVLPLSAQQRGIWFAEQAAPGRTAYHICRSISLQGPLHTAELTAALNDLTERHEALRTTFTVRDGTPLQRVAARVELSLPVHELPEDGRQSQAADRIARLESERAFDLATGPLLRCRLLRLSPTSHRLILTLHHIIADGWTVSRLLRDLGELYGARCRGEAAQLPPAAPYSAHTLEHRAWLTGPQAARSLAYWKQQAAELPPLELPTDRPRSATAGRRGALLPVELPAELLRALRTVAAPGADGPSGTVFPALLTAFATVLHRWTGQEDFAVGVPVAGRAGARWWESAGLFADFQPLRVDLAGNPSYAAAAERTRRSLLSGLDHPGVPFDRLVEEVRPPRPAGRNPLFDVACSLLAGHREELRLPGLDVTVERIYGGSAKLDLTLELAERPDGGAVGHLEYDRDLFADSTARRMAEHLVRLTHAAAGAPGTAIGALELLDATERRELLLLGTPPPAAYPTSVGLAELFREVAARRGDAPALAPAGPADAAPHPDALSYRELDRWSDAGAAELAARGVRRGDFVGLSGGRSVRYVVALLAILKCGAAYVPLDLAQPAERTALLIEQAGLTAVLHSAAGEAPRELGAGVLVVPLPERADDSRRPAPRIATGGEDPAYVMFTSGSTGVPKGVAVPHRAVVRLVRGGRFAEMTEDERWLSLAPPEFDASTLELWAPLLNGGVLLIGPPGVPDLHGLGALIESSRTTSLWLTAGLFHAMAEENPQGLRPLRRLLAGGDVLSPRQVRAALEVVQGPVVNGYGPTENTTFTTCQVMRSAEEVTDPVPIGRPVEGSTVYLVDSHGGLVPRGAVGELWTGGDGVALGYLGHPARTAACFTPDPFGPQPGRRLYRTGDRARWRPDGTLEFLGRADGQIKLRGFRIEPGELESALTAHPRAAHAVVAVRPLPGGDKHLIAWVVPADPAEASDPAAAERLAAELRDWLSGRVPAHLVPGRIVPLERLPLGPTGKVDRRALLDPARGAAEETSAGTEPRPGTEQLLAALFAQVLGVGRVGRLDDFFQLGGHSLAAIRLTGRIRSWFGAELPVSTVFAAPSVAGLAVAVDTARASGQPGRPPVRAGGQQRGPLSHAQERLWTLHLKDPASVAYTVPLELELTGPVAPQALTAALRALIDHHPALRTAVDDSGPEPLQHIHPTGLPFTLERTDLSGLEGPVADLARQDVRTEFFARPFDLTRAPLVRALLVQRAPDRSHLLLTVHHLVADGPSVAVLLRGLALACADPGALAPADPATPTGVDHARAERELLAGPARAELAGHWRRRLAGLPPRPPTAADPSPGDLLRVEIPAGTAAALRALAAGEGATLHMAVTAAVALLLAPEQGGDLVLGTPMADRFEDTWEDQVGLFLNTVPVRVDLRDGPSFRQALGRVRLSLLDAARHAALPYEQIAEQADGDRVRQPGGGPARGQLVSGQLTSSQLMSGQLMSGQLIGTLVQVQPALPARLRLAEAEAVLRPAHHGTAKFDLTLSLFDGGAELTGFWEFRTAAYSPEDVRRLHARLLALLAAVAADPEARPGASASAEGPAGAPAESLAEGQAERPAEPPAVVARPAAPDVEFAETVADIWQELLGGDRPGPADDFFTLGGSSITATRVISRLRGRTRREVPLKDLYDRPVLADFAARVAGAPLADGRPPLTRTGADHGPLSFAQVRHWVLDRLRPGTAANNIPLALRLRGPLDPAALEQALGLVAARQSALRTVFTDRDGVPEQRVLPPRPVTLPVTEVADEAAARAAADQEAALPFDLTAAPPWRAGLLHLEAGEHWLLLTFHHIIADGWSTSVLLDELALAYAHLRGNTGAPLPPAPSVQYLDHAIGQREWLSGERLAAEAEHWRHLRGTPPLELPRPRERAGAAAGSIPVSLTAAWRREAEALTAGEQASLYMLLLALWSATLQLHTGQQDFAVGTYTAGRPDTALEGLVGFFVNNLALRCDLSGDPDWRTRLGRARAVCTTAFEHQELPFEKVMEAAGTERSSEHTPLFQTLCVLQNYPAWPERMDDLRLDLVRRPYDRADFDVTLWLRPDEHGGLTGGIDHDTAALDEATAERIARTFRTFAEAAVARPQDRPRDALPAPRPVRPALARGAGPWLHQRTAAAAARTPDAPALVEYDQADGAVRITTHGELDRAANRLAHRLRALGVGPERRVAVLLGRSAQAVTAFLAVLKAGGGYVPVDPGYPPARIRALLEDSGAHLVLHHGTVDEGPGTFVDLADPATARALAALPDTAPADPGAGDPAYGERLAYAIFTSGSTGRPKAVAVSHANLASYLDAIAPELAVRRGERVLGFASVSFDASVEELYPALAAGAAVVLRPDQLRTPDSEFDAFLAATGPTVLSLPVSFWHAWVERMTAEGRRVPRRVHTLLLNAEAPAPARYRDWLRLCDSPVRWINTYGPTEATVTATLHEPPSADEVPERFPIGAVLANATLHVLDRHGTPVPPGTPGELLLGGHGVARGYLGRPAATARAWPPDPFSAEPGARLYRTGDRVRQLPGGELEFLGRLDHQLKIRGYRVEPGEVEAALAEHPAVRQCAVLAYGAPEALRLVAYAALVPAGEATTDADRDTDAERIRRDLAARLPEQLVPSRILLLDRLPLTPNAKVDRAALAARLEQDLRAAGQGGSEPELTPRQTVLAGVWRQVLGRDRIRPGENFFALGGDSLLAVQVAVRARSVGLRLEARDLFRHQTLAELAAACGDLDDAPAPPDPPAGSATRLDDRELADLMARLKGR